MLGICDSLFVTYFFIYHFQKSKQDDVELSPLAGEREVIRNARKAIKLYKKCKQTDETKVRTFLLSDLFETGSPGPVSL